MSSKKAYLILAHNNPSQLLKLLSRLKDANSWFFLHIDIKSPIEKFQAILENTNFNLVLVERENGKWGGLGIVKATLNGLNKICNHEVKFDYIHLLSGNDYPIVSNKVIDDFLGAHKDKIFIEYFPMPVKKWNKGGMTRLQWYNFIRIQYYNSWKWYTLMIVNKLIAAISLFRRKFPSYLKPFGGSQWWSITLPAAEYILQFVKQHPDYLRYHRQTLLPDEIFFQTILANATEEWLKNNLVNDNLRHILWSKPGATKFPLFLTMDDYEDIISSGKLWARKFDMNTDTSIFDALDHFAGYKK